MIKVDSSTPKLILASGSATRRRLLEAAGLRVTAISSDVDEAAIKQGLAVEMAPAEAVAQALAERKAMVVSPQVPGAFVIGADLVLVCDGELFDKAGNRDEARDHLRRLSGRAHDLVSAVAVVRDGAVLWRHVEHPRLTMRPLSDDDIARYMAQAGDEVMDSVGAYHLEGVGAQLFERVDGDFFSILGLPLLPLLAFLRTHDIVPG